jgi:hypothetical protein
MREQTRRNAGYLMGLNTLTIISNRLGWSKTQYEAARAELIRQLKPTLAEI